MQFTDAQLFIAGKQYLATRPQLTADISDRTEDASGTKRSAQLLVLHQAVLHRQCEIHPRVAKRFQCRARAVGLGGDNQHPGASEIRRIRQDGYWLGPARQSLQPDAVALDLAGASRAGQQDDRPPGPGQMAAQNRPEGAGAQDCEVGLVY